MKLMLCKEKLKEMLVDKTLQTLANIGGKT